MLGPALNRGDSMRLYVFRSGSSGELRAFTSDIVGGRLPPRFRPWHVVGAVAPDAAPPYGLSRECIKRAIDAQGFQLWRLKANAKAD
jgi:hypothetical protein